MNRLVLSFSLLAFVSCQVVPAPGPSEDLPIACSSPCHTEEARDNNYWLSIRSYHLSEDATVTSEEFVATEEAGFGSFVSQQEGFISYFGSPERDSEQNQIFVDVCATEEQAQMSQAEALSTVFGSDFGSQVEGGRYQVAQFSYIFTNCIDQETGQWRSLFEIVPDADSEDVAAAIEEIVAVFYDEVAPELMTQEGFQLFSAFTSSQAAAFIMVADTEEEIDAANEYIELFWTEQSGLDEDANLHSFHVGEIQFDIWCTGEEVTA